VTYKKRTITGVLPDGTAVAPFSQDTEFGQLIWTNTYHSFSVDPSDSSKLYATMLSYLRYVPGGNPWGDPGTLMQIGKWTATFSKGKIKKMVQNVIYQSYVNQSDPSEANPCRFDPAPAAICVSDDAE
jgi:hypothetical protein